MLGEPFVQSFASVALSPDPDLVTFWLADEIDRSKLVTETEKLRSALGEATPFSAKAEEDAKRFNLSGPSVVEPIATPIPTPIASPRERSIRRAW